MARKQATAKSNATKLPKEIHVSESEDSPAPKRNRQTPVDTFWDEEDQEKLEATHAAEVTLWNKCERFLGVNPPQIFGDAEFVQLAKPMPNDAPGDIKKKIWPIVFCNNLSELISCQYFKSRPSYVLYVLQVAMYWRLKRDQRPDMTLLQSGRNDDIIDTVRRSVQGRSEEFSDELAQDIRIGLIDRLGQDLPAHYKFLYGIQKIVHQQNKARGVQATAEPELGITGRDAQAVIEAWDAYATEGDNQIELKTITGDTGYSKNASKSRGKTRSQVFQIKKDWIIQDRQKRNFVSRRRQADVREDDQEDGEEDDPEDQEDDQEDDPFDFNQSPPRPVQSSTISTQPASSGLSSRTRAQVTSPRTKNQSTVTRKQGATPETLESSSMESRPASRSPGARSSQHTDPSSVSARSTASLPKDSVKPRPRRGGPTLGATSETISAQSRETPASLSFDKWSRGILQPPVPTEENFFSRERQHWTSNKDPTLNLEDQEF